MITLQNIDDYFTYHPPTTQERIDAHNVVNDAAKAWAEEFLKWAESGSDVSESNLECEMKRFFRVVLELVKDKFSKIAILASHERYKDIVRFSLHGANKDVEIHAAMSEIQFCRMMANQAITIADISRK